MMVRIIFAFKTIPFFKLLVEDTMPPLKSEKPHPIQRRMSRRISYMMSTMGTGQAQLTYPHLSFHPKTFFALGSPVGNKSIL